MTPDMEPIETLIRFPKYQLMDGVIHMCTPVSLIFHAAFRLVQKHPIMDYDDP